MRGIRVTYQTEEGKLLTGATCAVTPARRVLPVVGGAVADGLGLEWLEVELGRGALAAAWPHARPLALAGRGRLLTALARRVVHACAEGTGEGQARAAAGVAAAAGDWWVEAALAVGAHGLLRAPVAWRAHLATPTATPTATPSATATAVVVLPLRCKKTRT